VLSWILLGAGFAFAAAIQPGPLQAFLVSRVLRHGWKRTLPAALSPLLSDGPIALLTLGALRTLPLWAERGLRVGRERGRDEKEQCRAARSHRRPQS